MGLADDIKARLDIVDIVSETVTLKKSGRHYMGFCPFHLNTNTPSFAVFPETQTWRCFGACAEGGDLFSFVMKREGFTFREALETLARQAGIHLEPTSPQASFENERRRKLLALNAAAATYYHQCLKQAPPVMQYLTGKRGLTADTIAAFQLGYAPGGWENLKQQFLKRGYSAEELLAVGLIVERDERPAYDRFRNRLMIPIRDNRGDVIGFGARALAADQQPKYLNSPQTELFDKSATLYGLDLAKQNIRTANQVVIVEGYMDVIQAYQHGAKNVVAQMGTALTEAQLKRVAPLATQIVLALDSDQAGNAATVRSLSVIRRALPKQAVGAVTSHGVGVEGHISQDVFIARLPAGQDPDDVLKQGLDAWEHLVNNAMPALDFYEQLVLKQVDVTTPQGKSFVVRELMPIYRDVGDEIERVARVQRLARQLSLNEKLLLAELKGRQPGKPPRIQRAPEPRPAPPLVEPLSAPESTGVTLEDYCLLVILAHPTALARANETLSQQALPPLTVKDLSLGDNRALFATLQLWTASEYPKLDTLVEMVDTTLEKRLATLVSHWHQYPTVDVENVHVELAKGVVRLRLQSLFEQIEQLQFLLQEATDNQQAPEVRRYEQLIAACSLERRKLHDTQNALSLVGQRRAEEKRY